MGALSNSGRKAANLTGFYKGIQSAGAAVFWRLDGLKTPFDTMFGATVCPLFLSSLHSLGSSSQTNQLFLRSGVLLPARSSLQLPSSSSALRTPSALRRT